MIFKGEKVLHIPRDIDRYQESLILALNEESIFAGFYPALTSSATINFIALPLGLALERLRGSKILHIHWLFFYALPWSTNKLAKKILRYHFYFLIRWSRLIGFKLVWTAHNVLPHTPIFDDDILARKYLLKNTNLVIAHNIYTVEELRKMVMDFEYVIIEQGAYPVEVTENVNISSERFNQKNFLIVGNIIRYKGILELLSGLVKRGSEELQNFHLEIIGLCRDATLRQEILELVKILRNVGVSVSFENKRLADKDLSKELASGKIILMPFTKITNSGSLIQALSHSSAILTFDYPQFSNYEGDNLIKVKLIEDGIYSMEEFIAKIVNIADGDIQIKKNNFVKIKTWPELKDKYLSSYKQVISE